MPPALPAALPSGPEDPGAWLRELQGAGRPFAARPRPWLHNTLNLACLAGLVGLAVLGWRVALELPLWAGLVLGTWVCGTTIFALFTLLVHEASHNQFVILRSARWRRLWNDVFGWAVCLLFFRHYELHWRRGHLEHHRIPLEESDPQNCQKYVLARRALVAKILKVFLIPFYELELYRAWMPRLDDRCPKPGGDGPSHLGLRILGFGVGWAAILAVPLTIAPLFTLALTMLSIKYAQSLNFVKSSLEHGDYRSESDPLLRTRGLRFALKSLVFPFCITPYHWEHHLCPSIPWYRLPRFRRTVEPRVPGWARERIYTPGPVLLRRVLLP